MTRPTFAQACAQFTNRYTVEHVPAWALKKSGYGKFYAPQFASDAEWYANAKFHGEPGHVGKRNECYTSNQSWPLGKWLAEPMPRGYKLSRDLYAVNTNDGETLFCLKAYSLAQAELWLPDDYSSDMHVGNTYHSERETRESYDVYNLPSQAAEALAALRAADTDN